MVGAHWGDIIITIMLLVLIVVIALIWRAIGTYRRRAR